MKNFSHMVNAINKVFINDLESMSIEELRAELTHYIEQSVLQMETDQIETTYKYLREMGEI